MADANRSGFVCLAGHPNVGKSTLLNRIVGRPISITAPKPQTTRNRILGIKTTDAYQVIFVDTPGLHEPTDALNVRMVGYAQAAMMDADLILMLMEPLRPWQTTPPARVESVLRLVKKTGCDALLAINKIDSAQRGEVLETIRWADSTGAFSEIFPISALSGKGVEEIENNIPKYLRPGPRYFEPESITDQSEQMIVAELIRQEVFRRTSQEVPYSTAVRIESMEEHPGRLSIAAKIFVERESQKGILIGKRGVMLKNIGRAARLKIESLLGTHVYLALHVSVLKNWSENPRHLAELGYPES